METDIVAFKESRNILLLASSEVDLMETHLLILIINRKVNNLLASSEVDLMETGGDAQTKPVSIPFSFFGS